MTQVFKSRRRYRLLAKRNCPDCQGSTFRRVKGSERFTRCHCVYVLDTQAPKKPKSVWFDGKAAALGNDQ